MKKIIKILYYGFFTALAVITLLLIFSIFPIAGYKVLVVQSGSMEPAIKMGGVVVVIPSQSYRVNDVITFGEMGKDRTPITHRVLEIKENEGKTTYITKGDANDTEDQQEVKSRDIKGKVLLSVPYIGYAVDTAKKPIGFILIIVIPAVIIISDEIGKIIKEIKDRKSKKPEAG